MNNYGVPILVSDIIIKKGKTMKMIKFFLDFYWEAKYFVLGAIGFFILMLMWWNFSIG